MILSCQVIKVGQMHKDYDVCVAIKAYVGRRMGNYTKFIFFSLSQIIQICKENFLLVGVGVGT